MDVPGIKILTGFLNLFLFVLPQVFQLHTVQYNQQPSCNDEKKIVRAMQSSSTVIFMLHNFNPSPNTLMHHVVREPCHTGYLNTVQHTDNAWFLSSPYRKHTVQTSVSGTDSIGAQFGQEAPRAIGTASTSIRCCLQWKPLRCAVFGSPIVEQCTQWWQHQGSPRWRRQHRLHETGGRVEQLRRDRHQFGVFGAWYVNPLVLYLLCWITYWFLICVFMFECNDFHDRNNDPCLDVGSIDDNRSFHTDGNAGRWVEWSFEHGSDIEAHPQSTLSCLGGGRRTHREWPRESQDTMERGR